MTQHERDTAIAYWQAVRERAENEAVAHARKADAYMATANRAHDVLTLLLTGQEV